MESLVLVCGYVCSGIFFGLFGENGAKEGESRRGFLGGLVGRVGYEWMSLINRSPQVKISNTQKTKLWQLCFTMLDKRFETLIFAHGGQFCV